MGEILFHSLSLPLLISFSSILMFTAAKMSNLDFTQVCIHEMANWREGVKWMNPSLLSPFNLILNLKIHSCSVPSLFRPKEKSLSMFTSIAQGCVCKDSIIHFINFSFGERDANSNEFGSLLFYSWRKARFTPNSFQVIFTHENSVFSPSFHEYYKKSFTPVLSKKTFDWKELWIFYLKLDTGFWCKSRTRKNVYKYNEHMHTW